MQLKNYKSEETRKCGALQEKKCQSVQRNQEMIPILELAEKSYKITIINMLKIL